MRAPEHAKPKGLRGWWRARQERRALRKLPSFLRGQAKFLAHYPSYTMGIGTYGLPYVHDWGEGSTLRIGAYCSIGHDVQIFLGGQHRVDWASSYPFPAFFDELKDITDYSWTRGDVIVGNDVWISTGVTILAGVTIGDGAVIGANAVVSRDVPPYAVVVGNPGKVVRWRFDEPTRIALLESRWWHWPADEVRQIARLLCSTDLGPFLAYARERKARDQGSK